MFVACAGALLALCALAAIGWGLHISPDLAPRSAGAGSTGILDELTTSSTALLGYEIVAVYPHDPEAYTQGLLWHAGRLFESTGRYGQSSLREVELETGRIVREQPLERSYFGEGLALLNDELFWLTWRERTLFVLGRDDFRFRRKFTYDGEGWGLTTDGARLIMSDGTAELTLRDPATFAITRKVAVWLGPGQPSPRLNELELVRGWVLANAWQTDRIAVIDPDSGAVGAWIELAGLPAATRPWQKVEVLNGIAWDQEADRLFVTGKLWPRLFEIRLVMADAHEGASAE